MIDAGRTPRSDVLTSRLHGSLAAAVLSEFFSNSAYFAFTNIIFESLREGIAAYVREPDFYSMLFAVSLQAYVLGRADYIGRPIHFLGNLIGPAVYSAIELVFEGARFFEGHNHIAYWIFALAIGALQSRRTHAGSTEAAVLLVIENIVRAAILVAMYWLFEVQTNVKNVTVQGFLNDSSHVFVVIVVPLLGALLGFTSIVAMRRMSTLRDTAGHLRNLSEWSMGRDLVSRVVEDPRELDLQRRERTVLFMDIRGFTKWSDGQSPDAVVSMLNSYFGASEQVWTRYDILIARLIADEIFLVLATPEEALPIAQQLRTAAGAALKPYGLSVGIGINFGPVMEGMIGSGEIRVYDVIGDTVNTGARLCSAAAAGEILVADRIVKSVASQYVFGEAKFIEVKGKSEPLLVHPLLTASTS